MTTDVLNSRRSSEASTVTTLSSSSDEFSISELGSVHTEEFAANMVELLNRETRDVIKATWAKAVSRMHDKDVTPVATFVSIFFSKFFELCPEASLLFANDMSLQGKSLTNALTGMLEFLVNPKKLQNNVQRLAKMHLSLGITPEMFSAFGEALIFALKERLGELFKVNVERSWRDGYLGVSNLIVQNMQEISLQPNDIPSWMIDRYKQHHTELKKSFEKATSADAGEVLLNSFFTHFSAISMKGTKLLEKADPRLRKVIVWTAVSKMLDALEKPRNIKKELKHLFVTHAKMGVDDSMLEALGKALRAAIRDAYKVHATAEEYTLELDMIWKRCYRLLSITMAAGIRAETKSTRKDSECSVM